MPRRVRDTAGQQPPLTQEDAEHIAAQTDEWAEAERLAAELAAPEATDAELEAGEDEGEYVGEHTEDISYKLEGDDGELPGEPEPEPGHFPHRNRKRPLSTSRGVRERSEAF